MEIVVLKVIDVNANVMEVVKLMAEMEEGRSGV